MEPAINQLHIRLGTGNQFTAYQSIGTHNKIDDLKHQDNGILAYSYFSSRLLKNRTWQVKPLKNPQGPRDHGTNGAHGETDASARVLS